MMADIWDFFENMDKLVSETLEDFKAAYTQ